MVVKIRVVEVQWLNSQYTSQDSVGLGSGLDVGSEGSRKIWHEQLPEVGTSGFFKGVRRDQGFNFRPKGMSMGHLVLKLKGNIWN